MEDSLSLDAVDLEILGVNADGVDSTFRYDKVKGTLTVRGIPRTGTRSTVQVRFAKQVSDETIFGLYKSKHGKSHLLVTDLEPAQARTVFPCKDEPEFKAVFRVSVTTQKGLSVITNTPLASKEEVDGWAKFAFEPSPRMSTYLFFLGIGRFEETRKMSGRVTLLVASRPGQSKNAQFILDISSALLKEYERYFGIPYPLAKLHLVALPEYHTGAMENWGAITSREAFVLLDSDSSASDRLTAAHVMSHEIAHQWFGDLVTMKWWDDLWLNESFASVMDDKILERLHPEWDNWRDFLRTGTFRALNADALSGTHPIQAKVKTVDEIEGIFDDISYGKGAAVLRMLESYIGESAFRKGVSSYLRRFSYSNASGEDLWKSLKVASGLPVSSVARAWITKPGFPLVRVVASKGSIILRQARFGFARDPFKTRSRREVWPIPLSLTIDGEPKKLLLDRRTASLKSRGRGASVLVNPRRTGFYSVLYDADAYDRIADSFSELHSHDRAGIMNDLYLFLQAGMIEPKFYFRFVYLSSDLMDPLTAQTITEQLVNLRAIADEAAIVRGGYTQFYDSQIKKVGVTGERGEDVSMGELREAIAIELSRTNTEFARTLSPKFDDYESVEPDLRAASVISYAMTKGAAAFEQLVELAKSAKSEVERRKFYLALTSFKDPGLVEKTLELPIGGEVSRSDSAYVLGGASVNPNARAMLWNWVVRRYDLLHDIYGGSQQFFLFMNGAIPRCGIGREAEVRKFIRGKRYREGEMTFRRTFEILKINSGLRQRLLIS